jgi:hypothetical protein
MNPQGHLAYALAPLAGGARLPARRESCPMCGHAGAGAASCARCGAPLTPPPRIDDPQEAGRRGSPRVERIESVLWQPAGGAEAIQMRLQDLSFTGMSLDSLLPVPEGQVARVRAPNLDGVVEVVNCRREAGDWRVHARLLTLRLLTRAGAFVSTAA